jgi:hypothetical protein
MAATKPTTRLRALDFAVASSTEEDSPQDIVCRAQIYADWLDGVYTVELKYDVKPDAEPATTAAGNVVDLKRH